MDKKTYMVVLNSVDKISGTNNNANFSIRWDNFLDRSYDLYKVVFNFQTVGGFYKDGTYGGTYTSFNVAKLICNLQGRAFSFDSTNNTGSNVLGIIKRGPQTTTTTSNTLSCWFYENASKTVAKPTQDYFNIQIYNLFNNSLLVDTDTGATALSGDMSAWIMMLEFIPITESKI